MNYDVTLGRQSPMKVFQIDKGNDGHIILDQ